MTSWPSTDKVGQSQFSGEISTATALLDGAHHSQNNAMAVEAVSAATVVLEGTQGSALYTLGVDDQRESRSLCGYLGAGAPWSYCTFESN